MQNILDDTVDKYVNQQMYTLDSFVSVTEATQKMINNKFDSIIVLEDNNIVGLVTGTDILAKIVAKGKNPNTTQLADIKNSPILDIDKNARVVDAIEIMNKHNIRRLLVRDGQEPIGLITRKQIVGNMGTHDVILPELDLPDQINCPYCESLFSEKNILSKHIDDIHIGKGLLEGNLKRG